MAERVGYYSPETAKMILLVVEELKRSGFLTKAGSMAGPRWNQITGIIAYTPSGGIAARSGTSPGKATCDVYRIDDSETLVNVKDNEGNNESVTVYHIGSSAVQGNTYIQAKLIYGMWVVDMEDCG